MTRKATKNVTAAAPRLTFLGAAQKLHDELEKFTV